jgi:hypothetical protein
MSNMKINVDIELKDIHIEYLKRFKEQEKLILFGYNPIVEYLEYLGILLTTNIENKNFSLLTGIGKEILNKI